MGPSLALPEFTVWPGVNHLSLRIAQMLLPKSHLFKVVPQSLYLPFLPSIFTTI